MTSKKGKYLLRPIENGNYQKKKEEYQLCQTPGCRNVIAIWAQVTGPSHGLCMICRRRQ